MASKNLVQLEGSARATVVRGLGVGITGPWLPYGVDSTENWDNDEDYSCAGLLCKHKNEVGLHAAKV